MTSNQVNADLRDDLSNRFDIDGDGQVDGQTMQVQSVGMDPDSRILRRDAEVAGTEFSVARGATEFENALVDILADIRGDSGRSMAPASDKFPWRGNGRGASYWCE